MMSCSFLKRLLAAVLLVSCACSDKPTTTLPGDGVACGATRCAADEVCVHPCSAGPGCSPPPPFCVQRPEPCGRPNLCNCLPEDPCREAGGGTCPAISNDIATCVCSN